MAQKTKIKFVFKQGKKEDFFGIVIGDKITPFCTSKDAKPKETIVLLVSALNDMAKELKLRIDFDYDFDTFFKNYKINLCKAKNN